jgi:WD40 repeat protein
LSKPGEFLTLRGHENFVTGVGFCPDGGLLATAGYDETIRLWDVATGTPRASGPGHRGKVWALVFSLDGNTLLTCDGHGTIRLWHVAGFQRSRP